MPQSALERLVSWATAHGAALHPHLAISHSPTSGHGLVALQPIPAGSELLRVPYALLLTSRAVPPDFAHLGQTNALALALLAEARHPKAWALPLSILPDAFDTPLFWSPAERAHLRGSPLLEWAASRSSNIERSFGPIRERWAGATVVGADGATRSLALDDFRWALSVAWSRSFMVELAPGERKTATLVPLGDLLNHAEEERANVESASDAAGAAFVFRAGRPIRGNEELTLSYGAQGEPSNAILMLDYGFCLPYSSHDTAAIDVSPPATEASQVEWLRRLQLDGFAARVPLSLRDDGGALPDRLPQQLLIVLRVRALGDAELRDPQQLLRPLDAAAEARALRVLSDALRRALAAYPRSLAEGERHLAQLAAGGGDGDGGAAAHRVRCAVALTVGEQRVLAHWLRLATRLEHTRTGSAAEEPPPPTRPARDPPASAPPLHTFTNDATLEAAADGGGRRRHAVLEVRPRRAGEPLVGVFVASGGLEAGDLVGCYTGAIVDGAARAAKQQVAPESHLFAINATHAVDPTSARGRMDDTSPPYKHEMAVVNEPHLGLPNVFPFDYEYGRCRDRDGVLGVAYVAAREIEAGDEVTVCYGSGFRRGYESTCADEELLARWTALQWRLLGSTVRVV